MPKSHQTIITATGLTDGKPVHTQSLNDDGYPIDTILASEEPEEVAGDKLQVEMMVCWSDYTWSDGDYVYVSSIVREKDIERFARDVLMEALEVEAEKLLEDKDIPKPDFVATPVSIYIYNIEAYEEQDSAE